MQVVHVMNISEIEVDIDDKKMAPDLREHHLIGGGGYKMFCFCQIIFSGNTARLFVLQTYWGNIIFYRTG